MSLKKSQKLSDNFILSCDHQGNNFLESEQFGLSIRLKKNGYIPRSGLLFTSYLNSVNAKGTVLDIGTGESGLLAYYMYARVANKVIACDKDPLAICYASKASLFAKNISWVVSDVFSNIDKYPFDFIVSNPPQMPMLDEGSLHDCGGYDGRDIILRIIKKSADYLSSGGKLFLLCFDFIGAIERFNSEPSICEIALDYGLIGNVAAEYQRCIRRGGKTEENLVWINKIYPKYSFRKLPEGNLYHKIFILEFKKLKN